MAIAQGYSVLRVRTSRRIVWRWLVRTYSPLSLLFFGVFFWGVPAPSREEEKYVQKRLSSKYRPNTPYGYREVPGFV